MRCGTRSLMGTEFEAPAASKGPSHFSHCAAKNTRIRAADLFAHGIRRAWNAWEVVSLSFTRWLYAVAQFCYGTLDWWWGRRPLLFQEEIFSRSESSYTGLGLPLVKGIANISLCKWMDFPLFLCGSSLSLSLALINYTHCMTRTKAAVVCH